MGKMGIQRKIRLKGWCDLHDGTMADVQPIRKELEKETRKEDILDMLVRSFSLEEIEDDTVDITIDDRLGTSIIKGRYGAGLEFNYKTCHHGLTIFDTTRKGAEESVNQQLTNEALREATTKTIVDVEKSRG